jgi:ATP-dependent Clp protease ATP-binding subunit ClpA
MFERFTEKARRAIFFARSETSKFGGHSIESEHLLLGLVAADKSILLRFLAAGSTEVEIREAIVRSTAVRPPISTSVDLPLSNECKRILGYAAEEAERLGHQNIDVDHLLLGILREESCFAARLLVERGLQLAQARTLPVSNEQAILKQSSIGSGSGLRAPVMPHVQFVEAGGKETLLMSCTMQFVPRNGDRLLVRREGSADASYRVQEVVWEFQADANASRVTRVVAKVVVEQAGELGSKA